MHPLTKVTLVTCRQFCGSEDRVTWSVCSHQGEAEGAVYVVETGQRRMVVFAQLENQGENAYGATIHISTSSNLLFSSLIVKVTSHAVIKTWKQMFIV